MIELSGHLWCPRRGIFSGPKNFEPHQRNSLSARMPNYRRANTTGISILTKCTSRARVRHLQVGCAHGTACRGHQPSTSQSYSRVRSGERQRASLHNEHTGCGSPSLGCYGNRNYRRRSSISGSQSVGHVTRPYTNYHVYTSISH